MGFGCCCSVAIWVRLFLLIFPVARVVVSWYRSLTHASWGYAGPFFTCSVCPACFLRPVSSAWSVIVFRRGWELSFGFSLMLLRLSSDGSLLGPLVADCYRWCIVLGLVLSSIGDGVFGFSHSCFHCPVRSSDLHVSSCLPGVC